MNKHAYINELMSIYQKGVLGHDYFVDLDGNPVKRTPLSHPYSFDEHVL